MDDTKKQIFGHLFRAAAHLIGSRESGASRPAPPTQKSAPPTPGPAAGNRALAKPLVLKRPPSCCAVKVGGGQGGGRAGR